MSGVARQPHTHTTLLQRSFEDEAEESTLDFTSRLVACPQCYPILSRYSTIFKGLLQQGSELKKRKKLNPVPKRPETELTHCRDITAQNEWLRAKMFDSLGNYLYCYNCIISSFGISKDRLIRQQIIP